MQKKYTCERCKKEIPENEVDNVGPYNTVVLIVKT